MIPGINPKKMKQMMKQLGMKMEEIEGVERVVVYTTEGEYVFEPAEVVVTIMQGQKTYQLQGSEPVFFPKEVAIPNEDVMLVAEQAQVSPDKARAALKEANGEIADAIIRLTSS
ncbi:MAG: nascent polypeptide-associated complex protein [Methanomicrobiales archaeon]|jgi:nascent polypeptide-associated complex subunit alpha|nr:nascent polypeptide-associated complex protein [Methanomicrobiales archaeon]